MCLVPKHISRISSNHPRLPGLRVFQRHLHIQDRNINTLGVIQFTMRAVSDMRLSFRDAIFIATEWTAEWQQRETNNTFDRSNWSAAVVQIRKTAPVLWHSTDSCQLLVGVLKQKVLHYTQLQRPSGESDRTWTATCQTRWSLHIILRHRLALMMVMWAMLK